MNQPKISLIVPVYNVEAYLDECINSIITQSYTNIEIILINDGSTDKSGDICDRYANIDNRIVVIHKENGGLSDARNTGIDIATGYYVLFVDSDDFIGADSLSHIIDTISGLKYTPDVIFLEAVKIFPNGAQISLGDGYCNSKINGKQKKDVLKHLSLLPKFPGSAWSKMVNRRFLVDNSLYFEKGKVCEDIDWTVRLLKIANDFAYCHEPYYYYRQGRGSSITNNIGIKNFQDLFEIIEKYSNKNPNYTNYQREINSFMAYEYTILLYIYSKLTKEQKLKYSKKLKGLSWLLKCRNDKKTLLIRLAYDILGINLTAKILNVYIKHR